MRDLAILERSLGVSFKDQELLQRALLHSSYVNEHPDQEQESNERLEFLGDAVLACAVAEELFRLYPELSEGDLTVLRSALVSGQQLAQVARGLELGAYLSLGAGEERSGGRDRDSNLAGALEALLGAVFLDRGYARCRQVVRRLFKKELRPLTLESVPKDPKSQLQQALQARWSALPNYRTVRVVGPDHDRHYTVEVSVGDEVLGTGAGRRRALAERAAAQVALQKLQGEEG